MRIRCCNSCPPSMTFTIGLLILVNGLVIPLTGYVSALVGCVVGWLLVATALLIGWNLAARKGGGLLRVLDLYLFTSFAMALVWYTMWALDGSSSRSEQVSVPVEPDASPFFVYLVISYNVVGSLWFIGPARMFPVSTAAYVWGFVVLVVGIWRVFAVLSLIVSMQTSLGGAAASASSHSEAEMMAEDGQRSEFVSVQQQMPIPFGRPPLVGPSVPSVPQPVMMPYTGRYPGGAPAIPPPPMSIATLRHLQEMSKAAKAASNLTLASTMAAAASQLSVNSSSSGVGSSQKPKDA